MRAIGVLAFVLAASAAFAGEVPEWNQQARRKFADQRFGIFIHWGLYANYAQGEWYLHNGVFGRVYDPKVGHGLDEDAYARMMYGFYPSKYDACEWVSLFKEAGAKYVTITSRHHDGFSLWPTKADDGYNIANTPFKRDILGELAKACHDEGLQINFYYSLMDWHRKDYPPGCDSAGVKLRDRKPDYASYKKFMMAQIGELIDNYKPGNIWFDGEWEHAQHKGGKWVRTLDWELDDIYDFIHSKRVLVANNNHQPIREKEDIQLFERDLPGVGKAFSANQPMTLDRPVEQCDVLQHGVWGYKIGETRFRTAEDVVAMVARAAAKGSNLLMNIGPDGSGQLPAKAVDVMKKVGVWFRQNGESIYGTDACPLGDGKAVVSTRRGKVIYLHFLDPTVKEIDLKLTDEIASVTALATGKPVTWMRSTKDAVRVSITRDKDDAFDSVVKIVFK